MVVVTPGAKPIMYYAIMAIVNPGDEVIYPNPGFPIYESAIELAGGTPIALPLTEATGFKFSIEDLRSRITPKTKMLILNSPQNPTGGILTQDDLKQIAEHCRQARSLGALRRNFIAASSMMDSKITPLQAIPA